MQNLLSKRLIFIAFVFALILYHIFGNIGHYGYDDMEYAHVAARLSEGIFDPGNHNSFRLTLVGMTAISYILFGINDFASSLPALLVSIGTLCLIYRILRYESWQVLVFGLVLFAFNNWTFFYSDKLMPDSFVTFFAFLFCYVVYAYKYRPRKIPVSVYSFSAAMALFLCFNSKETVVLLAPLVGWLLITDIIQKRSVKFWVQFIAFSVAFLVGYLLVCELVFGNAVTRFNAIIANSYLNACSYDQQPFLETLKRISYGLAKLFLISDMLLGFFIVLTSLFFVPIRQLFKMNDRKSFFILSSVILMVSANFMSISVTSYIPMCPDPRHYLFIIPVVTVAAALILKDHFGQLRFRILFFVLVLIAFCLSLIFKSDKWFKLYLPVLVAILPVLFLKNSTLAQRLFVLLFVFALLVQPVNMIRYAGKVDYRMQKEIVMKELIRKNTECVVITDEVQKRLGNYYSGFSSKAKCRFINYAEADTFHFQKTVKKMLLNNWYTRYLSGMDDQDLPYYASLAENPVFRDEKLNLSIYELNDIKRREKVFSTVNDFESPEPCWNETLNKSSELACSGVYSEKLGEFSANCSLSLDSLLPDCAPQIVVSPKLKIFAINSSECNLVISLDSGEKQYFWKGYDLNKYVKSKAGWWSASLSEIIERSEIQKNSTMKVYIWNNKKNEIYIDDFKVEVFAISK